MESRIQEKWYTGTEERNRKEEKERRKKSTELRCASTNKVKMEAQDLTERE